MKKLPFITVCLLLALSLLCFFARELGNQHRAARANAEFVYGAPAITQLVQRYTNAFIETAKWPAPGAVQDDAFTFIKSREASGARIDVYETMFLRKVEIYLNQDGTIECLPESFY